MTKQVPVDEWQTEAMEILTEPNDRESLRGKLLICLQQEVSVQRMKKVLRRCFQLAQPGVEPVLNLFHAAEGVVDGKYRAVLTAHTLIVRDCRKEAAEILASVQDVDKLSGDARTDMRCIEARYELEGQDLPTDQLLRILKMQDGVEVALSMLRILLKNDDVARAQQLADTIIQGAPDPNRAQTLVARVAVDFPAFAHNSSRVNGTALPPGPHIQKPDAALAASLEERAEKLLSVLQPGKVTQGDLSTAMNFTRQVSDQLVVRLWDAIVQCDPLKTTARDKFFRTKRLASGEQDGHKQVYQPRKLTPEEEADLVGKTLTTLRKFGNHPNAFEGAKRVAARVSPENAHRLWLVIAHYEAREELKEQVAAANQKREIDWDKLPSFESIAGLLPNGTEKEMVSSHRRSLILLAAIAGRDGRLVRHKFDEITAQLNKQECHRELVVLLYRLLSLSITRFQRSDDNDHQIAAPRSAAFKRAPAKNPPLKRSLASFLKRRND